MPAATNPMTITAAVSMIFMTPRKSELTGSPCWPASEILLRRPHIAESNHTRIRAARVPMLQGAGWPRIEAEQLTKI